jgi:hypothetical protein
MDSWWREGGTGWLASGHVDLRQDWKKGGIVYTYSAFLSGIGNGMGTENFSVLYPPPNVKVDPISKQLVRTYTHHQFCWEVVLLL